MLLLHKTGTIVSSSEDSQNRRNFRGNQSALEAGPPHQTPSTGTSNTSLDFHPSGAETSDEEMGHVSEEANLPSEDDQSAWEQEVDLEEGGISDEAEADGALDVVMEGQQTQEIIELFTDSDD